MSTGTEVARISVKVSPDTRQFRRDLKSDLEEIERSVSGDVEVKVHLGAGQAMADFRRLLAQMRREGAKGVRINAELSVDDDTDNRKSNGAGASEKNIFSRISDKLEKLTPSFGSGINATAGLTAIVGILAVAAPLMGLLTAGILALPGLISAVVTPVGAIALGLDGIKKAATDAGLIGEGGDGKTTLGENLKEIQKSVSDVFEKGLKPSFENIKNAIPQILGPMDGVAQGLSDMFKGFTDAVVDPDSIAGIQQTIKNIGDSMTIAAPGVRDFTEGMIDLATAFSEKMPAVAQWFNGAGQSFTNWVDKISTDGSLSSSFDALGRSLKAIAEAVGDMAGKSIEFLKNPENVEKVVGAFEKLAGIFVKVVEFSDALYKADKAFRDFWTGGDQPVQATSEERIKGLNDMFPEIASGAQGAADAIGQVATAVENVPSPTGSPLGDLLGGAQAGAPADAAGAQIAVPEIDTAAAEAKVTEYQSFVDSVSQNVRGSLEQATSGQSLPAPDFSAFKAAWEELPEMVTTAGQTMVNESAKIPQGIANGLSGMDGIGTAAGTALMTGILNGLQAGEAGVISYASGIADRIAAVKGPLPYDRVVLKPAGEALMQGLGKGMEEGFAPVLDQAKGLAGQIAEAFSNGGDPTSLLNGLDKGEIDRMEKVLALEEKRLANQAKALDYQAKATGNDALKARADELRLQKDQIGLQQDMLGLTQDYADEYGSISGGDDPLVKAASGLMSAPVDFAKATAGQFMSDLGISGDGLISKGITEGIQYLFQIGSVDEALSIKDREDSKRTRASAGR
ncbi:hypothetical protein ASE48_08345 [Mycobacterium sp. Root265]|uniref:hypothetical protein n=1 Tax=Mycobacterium sp. Root265 TaxID=1736504 RepID=UPI00070FF9FE|nr:hypothetical protein [Mycobacterium sp. Root265]KRD08567.1 hypothetical protein ASE48_08345 [Mycobacterium sp. Root265]